MPVATVRMFGSKMMSSAGKPTCSVSSSYARWQMRTLSSTSTAWPCSSNAITTTAAPYQRQSCARRRNSASPSLRLIELTIGLPCSDLSPASMTDHLLLSTIIGHGGDFVLAGDQPQELGHHGFAVEQGFVHVDVDDVRPAVDLLAGDFDGFFVLLVLDEPGELLASR